MSQLFYNPFFKYFLLIMLFTIILASTVSSLNPIYAQSNQVNVNLLFENPDYSVRETDIICDPSGRVIAVFYTNEGDYSGVSDTIYISVWDEQRGWSTPVDLIYKKARFPTLLVDQLGRVHIFWVGGNCIMHSFTRTSDLLDLSSWSNPDCIYQGQTFISSIDVYLGSDDTIHAAFTTDTGSAFYLNSLDQGQTWSVPQLLPGSDLPNSYAESIHLVVDDNRTIHVVWSAEPIPFDLALGVYYTRSNDNGQTWQPVFELAGRGNLEPNLVVSNTDDVHVVWNGNVAISKRYHRWTPNEGETWSGIVTIGDAPGGILGSPGITADSDGNIHVLMATDQGALYNSWIDGNWGTQQFWTQDAQTGNINMCTLQGNSLFGIFRERSLRIYTTQSITNAKPIPTIIYPVLDTAPTTTVQNPPVDSRLNASVDEKPSPQNNDRLVSQSKISENPGLPLIIGIAPVLILLAVVLIVKSIRENR